MSGFAVVDLETTGVYNTDRIVEIGVVLLDDSLTVEHEWSTLVNPVRDVAATHVHHLTASDLADAPVFADVAAHLAALLDQRVVVAHNPTFDLRMLAHALAHARLDHPDALVVVDTCRLARVTLAGPASLPLVCEYLSIDTPAHTALGDAQATALVLTRLVEQTDWVVPTGAAVREFNTTSTQAAQFLDGTALAGLLDYARQVRWDAAVLADPPPGVTRTAASIARHDRDTYLARLVANLPTATGLDAADLDPYLVALEEVLLDRLVTSDEAEHLAELAVQLGLTQDRVRAAHLAFLEALAAAAFADGVVTRAERADLDRVAGLLALHPGDVDAALDQARTSGAAAAGPAVKALGLAPGDRVVFTGEASVPRRELSAMAQAAGLVESSAVSKKTAAVVMADPLSQSTKARKARELGVPIIAEPVFVQICQDLTSGR